MKGLKAVQYVTELVEIHSHVRIGYNQNSTLTFNRLKVKLKLNNYLSFCQNFLKVEIHAFYPRTEKCQLLHNLGRVDVTLQYLYNYK